MEEFYWGLTNGDLTDEKVLDYISSTEIDPKLVKEFEQGMCEKIMSQ